jgi:hypothetical protein
MMTRQTLAIPAHGWNAFRADTLRSKSSAENAILYPHEDTRRGERDATRLPRSRAATFHYTDFVRHCGL